MAWARPLRVSRGRTYDLTGWTEEQRRALEFLLDERQITYTWIDAKLFVAPRHCAIVDERIASLTGIEPTAVAHVPPPVAAPVAGWYADPLAQTHWRWWDGSIWTDFTDGSPELYKRRPWLPPRGRVDRDAGIRGGGLAVLAIVAAILLSVAASLVAYLIAGSGIWVLIAAQLGLWTGTTGACVIAVKRYGRTRSLRDLGLERLRWSDVGVGIVVGFTARIALGIATVLLVLILDIDLSGDDGQSITGDLELDTLRVVIVGLILVVGAPFFEELFFRGLVQGVLTRRWGAAVGVYTQAILFTMVHVEFGMSSAFALMLLLQICIFGVILGALRWHSKRLAPGMVAHSVFNLFAVIAIIATT